MSINILCPYCFKHFKNSDVMLQCENNAEELRTTETGSHIKVPVCPKEDDYEYSNHWGTKVQTKHIFPAGLSLRERHGWKPIQEKKCDKCGAPSQRFVCPNCHNWLPTEMIEKGSEIISVVGGPASGKSNYIVALIHQLMKYQAKLGLSVTLQQVGRNDEEKTCNKYKAAKTMLFEERQALQKTQETKYPIPWIIRLESRMTNKAVYLVFYDTAGESFQDAEKIARDAQYFKESKAVIVAFDTLAIPKIKKILAQKEIENYNQAYDYKEMWGTIKNIAQQNSALKLQSRPYAFVFTKFDAVIDNADVLNSTVDSFVDDNGKFKNSSFIKDGIVSEAELKDCSDSISSFLKDEDVWDENSFATDIEQEWGANGRFFGVSALGGMTDDMMTIQTKGDNVEPIKVLDPLVWILIKLGDFGIKSK